MKKTLIALAVAASAAASGMAHAWTSGDFYDSLDIGGRITVDDYRQKWSWAVGSDINGFEHASTDMTENGTKLTITVTDDKPLLIGKTNESSYVPRVDGIGGVPLISFFGYDGVSVELSIPAGATDGQAYLNLPMKDVNGNKIGSVKVNASYAAAYASASTSSLYSLVAAADRNQLFFGGLPLSSSGGLKDAYAVAERTARFGSLSKDEMLAQIQVLRPDVKYLTNKTGGYTMNFPDAGSSDVFSAAYALGIVSGQTIEATFDESVTTTTEWSAPLSIAVTYN